MNAFNAIVAALLLAGLATPFATADGIEVEARACDIDPEDNGVWIVCDPGPKMFVCVPPQIPACRP